jgi:hypothetical protein
MCKMREVKFVPQISNARLAMAIHMIANSA